MHAVAWALLCLGRFFGTSAPRLDRLPDFLRHLVARRFVILVLDPGSEHLVKVDRERHPVVALELGMV